jgi:sugar phosphate isomerase/epimerase
MKIGLLPTGLLRSRVDFAELVRFAADHGYQAIDITSDRPDAIELARRAGLDVGVAGSLPPLILADATARETNIQAAIAKLDAVGRVGGQLVSVGHARVPDASDDENLEYARLGYGPVAEYAGKLGIKMVIEHWPNYGKNLATCPAMWRKLFAAVPQPSLGLIFDPSHLVFLGIDYLRALREFGGRVYYAHAKDTVIDREGLYQTGFLSGATFGAKNAAGQGWWRYCLPGLGEVRWGPYIATLMEIGYDGTIAVEHEDNLWGWRDDVEKAKRGLIVAQQYLRQFLA